MKEFGKGINLVSGFNPSVPKPIDYRAILTEEELLKIRQFSGDEYELNRFPENFQVLVVDSEGNNRIVLLHKTPLLDSEGYEIFDSEGNRLEYPIWTEVDYEYLNNKPSLDGVELSGNILTDDLDLQHKICVDDPLVIEDTTLSIKIDNKSIGLNSKGELEAIPQVENGLATKHYIDGNGKDIVDVMVDDITVRVNKDGQLESMALINGKSTEVVKENTGLSHVDIAYDSGTIHLDKEDHISVANVNLGKYYITDIISDSADPDNTLVTEVEVNKIVKAIDQEVIDKLDDEIIRAKEAERNETVQRREADNNLSSLISQEYNRAYSAENTLFSRISIANNDISILRRDLQSEISNRSGADANLNQRINNEIIRAESQENLIENKKQDKISADNPLSFSDNNLTLNYDINTLAVDSEGNIFTRDVKLFNNDLLISELIKDTATAENQLVTDKELQEAVISSMGRFRGNYTSIAQIRSITEPELNDYAFLSQSTPGGKYTYTRYKYSVTSELTQDWVAEYEINPIIFTQSQIDAINSGINYSKNSAYNNHINDISTNPHNITKDMLGIGKVENKTSSDILGELIGQRGISVSNGIISHSNTGILPNKRHTVKTFTYDEYGHVTGAVNVGFDRGIEIRNTEDTSKDSTIGHINQVEANANKSLKLFTYDTEGHIDSEATDLVPGKGISIDGDNTLGHEKTYFISSSANDVLYGVSIDKYGHISNRTEITGDSEISINGTSLLHSRHTGIGDKSLYQITTNEYGHITSAEKVIPGKGLSINNNGTLGHINTTSESSNTYLYDISFDDYGHIKNYKTIIVDDGLYHSNNKLGQTTASNITSEGLYTITTDAYGRVNSYNSVTGLNGISISGNKISHTNTVTGGSTTSESIPIITYDSQGHITKVDKLSDTLLKTLVSNKIDYNNLPQDIQKRLLPTSGSTGNILYYDSESGSSWGSLPKTETGSMDFPSGAESLTITVANSLTDSDIIIIDVDTSSCTTSDTLKKALKEYSKIYKQVINDKTITLYAVPSLSQTIKIKYAIIKQHN